MDGRCGEKNEDHFCTVLLEHQRNTQEEEWKPLCGEDSNQQKPSHRGLGSIGVLEPVLVQGSLREVLLGGDMQGVCEDDGNVKVAILQKQLDNHLRIWYNTSI